MGGAPGSVSVVHDKSPDKATACRLLRDIAARGVAVPPRCVDKPLILYGAGNLGRMAKDYLNHVGIPFRYVVDANPAAFSDDPAWKGIHVVGPECVSEADKNTSLLAVCISTVPYVPIYQSLVAQGWEHVVPFYDITEPYRDRHPLSNGWFAGRLDETDIAGIERVLERWGDDESCAHHIQFLAWRCLREEWTFDGAIPVIGDRYFIPEVRSFLNERESFLDVGAHHGEVSIKFSKIMDGMFKEITAIEPDGTNLSILRKNLDVYFQGALSPKIRIVDSVIGDRVGDGRFYDGLDYAAQLCAIGPQSMTVRTIDEMSIAPTFIKLHLEGAEFAAIRGGEATIRTGRPLIAATAYHSRLGLWKFPLWLMDNLVNYRFLLRLHGWCGTALVVYAIPQERMLPSLSHLTINRNGVFT